MELFILEQNTLRTPFYNGSKKTPLMEIKLMLLVIYEPFDFILVGLCISVPHYKINKKTAKEKNYISLNLYNLDFSISINYY